MMVTEEKIIEVINKFVGIIYAKSILKVALTRTNVDLQNQIPADKERLIRQLKLGMSVCIRDSEKQKECYDYLDKLFFPDERPPLQKHPEIMINITSESDILVARSKGRHFCKEIGFPQVMQIKIATAISELSRNIVQYAGTGRIMIKVIEDHRKGIEVTASDQGPGIHNLDEILGGQYTSKSGLGMGLLGTKNLMDEFDIITDTKQGTQIIVKKYIP
ncbi:anti-sigma regulatory factor [candidate division CSSED10-310 bacterium]|uniref:Anti-sigma regulatory factor n=1 Tax=candidate division CSSED10-310 bacterium TaxID=2855610 RepID=A0ABV6YVH5_UNCC1